MALVNLWVYEPAQLIKIVINHDPMHVNRAKEDIVRELRNVTEHIVVIDDIRYHVSPTDGLRRDMTDMYIHVVDEATNTVVRPEAVVRTIDANYDYLAHYYDQVGIHQVVPAEVKAEEVVFDSNLIAFIALVIALFIGFVTFAVVLCCLRYWYLSPRRGGGGGGNRPMKLREASPRPLKTPPPRLYSLLHSQPPARTRCWRPQCPQTGGAPAPPGPPVPAAMPRRWPSRPCRRP